MDADATPERPAEADVGHRPGRLPTDPAAGLFAEPPATGFTLWYRPQKQRGKRRVWTAVATCATERECTDAADRHPDKRGQYTTLPVGQNPNHWRPL